MVLGLNWSGELEMFPGHDVVVSPGPVRLNWIQIAYKPLLDVRQNPSRDTNFPSYRKCHLKQANKKITVCSPQPTQDKDKDKDYSVLCSC